MAQKPVLRGEVACCQQMLQDLARSQTPLHPAALASAPYGIVLVRVRVQTVSLINTSAVSCRCTCSMLALVPAKCSFTHTKPLGPWRGWLRSCGLLFLSLAVLARGAPFSPQQWRFDVAGSFEKQRDVIAEFSMGAAGSWVTERVVKTLAKATLLVGL